MALLSNGSKSIYRLFNKGVGLGHEKSSG